MYIKNNMPKTNFMTTIRRKSGLFKSNSSTSLFSKTVPSPSPSTCSDVSVKSATLPSGGIKTLDIWSYCNVIN